MYGFFYFCLTHKLKSVSFSPETTHVQGSPTVDCQHLAINVGSYKKWRKPQLFRMGNCLAFAFRHFCCWLLLWVKKTSIKTGVLLSLINSWQKWRKTSLEWVFWGDLFSDILHCRFSFLAKTASIIAGDLPPPIKANIYN